MTSIFETLEALQVLDSDAKVDIVCERDESYLISKQLGPKAYKRFFYTPKANFIITNCSAFEGVGILVDLNTKLGRKIHNKMQKYKELHCFRFECTPMELKKLILVARTRRKYKC